ncbi:MAG: error-prone DNA polymerase [Gemmataceae bacterium]|nr:error-prone DNA polymerase [Gemmataceae bacterium]
MARPFTVRYAELRCKTNYSFLQGAAHADELATRAAELGYEALAITDQQTLAGVVRAHVAAKAAGLKLLIGAEVTPEDAPPVLLYASDLAAYGRLARLITRGRRSAAKGECRLCFGDVAEHAEGLLAAVVPAGDDVQALAPYRDVFGDRCYLAVALHHGPDDEAELARFQQLARRARLPLVANNDVHYHVARRRPLHDVLTAIRHGTTVAELGERRFPNGERYLKSPAEMAVLFKQCPKALAHGLELAGRCRFSLDELRYQYADELSPLGQTPAQYLAQLTWAGARVRYPQGVPDKVADLLRRELALIEELRYEAYFLTVWDLVRFARSRSILCQGRGSAANSAVCFCLNITAVDPDRTDVLFERFVSREREEPPDIDVDFEHERREEVIQYVYEKYGRDRAALAAEVITYRPRSAVRDVGKALGLSLDRVDRLAKVLDPYGDEEQFNARLREAGLDPRAAIAVQLRRLTVELLGFPRHLSQHVGGFVITRGPLSEVVPIENAAMPGRTVVQWDKDDLDALGILKVDCLALGMLTAIRKCFGLVAAHHGRHFDLASVPTDDSAVYDMVSRADTVGVFQIESRAQMSMLPRLKPRCFYDLVIEVAIVRPGPIQGGMVHPYLRRRNGEEPVTYPAPSVEQVLGKTLGVPLFQEQVMRLAMVAGGFSAGEADQLRRAMAAWRRPGRLEEWSGRLRAGMLANGMPADFVERVGQQIRGFGEYGFPESHAASFAALAYVSAWLKCHYPAAFTAALLNSQPMGFYAPAQLVRDAREHHVEVRAVDVNVSEWDCTLEHMEDCVAPLAPVLGGEGMGVRGFHEASARSTPSPPSPRPRVQGRGEQDGKAASLALRLGFRLLNGFPQAAALSLTEARAAGGLFRSVSDLARRSRLSRALLARLAAADAFQSLGLERRTALWQVLSVGEELPLFAGLEEEETPLPPLAALPLDAEVVADYDSTGLSLRAHPIGLLRADLRALRVMPASNLAAVANRSSVRVAGLVLMRQKPSTAKGTVFVTLEDETGVVNLVVWPRVWERYRRIARGAAALLVDGRLERANGVTHVCATKLDDLSEHLQGIACRSRDFR